jgi:spore germination protein KA
MLLILLHLSNLRSLGVAYLKPFGPFYWKDLKDTMLRAPLWKMKARPQMLASPNSHREDSTEEPRTEPSQ